jgi:uncharacterized membrane protein YfcA
MYLAAWFLISILGGITAAISGFGIGSLLTPALSTRFSVADAILAVSIPHAVATAFRCFRLRKAIDWTLIRGFGVASAAGGLAGALLLFQLGSHVKLVLGILLVATAVAGLTGWTRRVSPGGTMSVALGGLSGLFGGMAGNQGGLRAAALTTYHLAPAQFVATSTAVGLAVDAARLPIYMARGSGRLMDLALPMAIATLGVLAGTLLGERVLLGLSRDAFTKIVSLLIAALGVWMLSSPPA